MSGTLSTWEKSCFVMDSDIKTLAKHCPTQGVNTLRTICARSARGIPSDNLGRIQGIQNVFFTVLGDFLGMGTPWTPLGDQEGNTKDERPKRTSKRSKK
jgi:hypothetical protein